MAGQYCSYCGSRNRTTVYWFKKLVPVATKNLNIWDAKYAKPYCKKCGYHEEVFYHIITLGWFRVHVEHEPVMDVKIELETSTWHDEREVKIKKTNKLMFDSWIHDTDY